MMKVKIHIREDGEQTVVDNIYIMGINIEAPF